MMILFWTAVPPEYGVIITYGNIYKLTLQCNWCSFEHFINI